MGTCYSSVCCCLVERLINDSVTPCRPRALKESIQVTNSHKIWGDNIMVCGWYDMRMVLGAQVRACGVYDCVWVR